MSKNKKLEQPINLRNNIISAERSSGDYSNSINQIILLPYNNFAVLG